MARARLFALTAVAWALFGCAHTDSGEDDSPDGRRYDARLPGDGSSFDAMPPKPDAAPTPDAEPVPDSAVPSPDAPTMVCGVPGPDGCGAAMDLTAAASNAGGTTLTGDTTGLDDDLQPEASTCTGYFPDGPDAVYKVTADTGDRITATVTPTDWDASIYIASACDSGSCVAGADAVFDGDGASN